MSITPTNESTPRRPLRLWPGVLIAVLILLARLVLPFVLPDAGFTTVLAPMAGGAAIVLWWLFFSRAPWVERIGAVVVMIAAVFAMHPLLHQSIAGGAQGMLGYMLPFPLMALALVAWAWATRHSTRTVRRVSMVVSILLGCAALALVRTAGVRGGGFELHWRWTPTPEERLLADARYKPVDAVPGAPTAPPSPAAPTGETPVAPDVAKEQNAAAAPTESRRAAPAPTAPAPAAPVKAPPAPTTAAEWPGFRGPNRDSVISGVRINTDWSASPPVELWRRPIGPGWSSFAVQGNRIYTQEQRGDQEIVACYDAATGAPVWMHRDATRFWESNGGPGPRGTPTLSSGRVYTFGATGIVNALDAATGAVVWSRNAASDARRQVPYWGFASSPLVVGDVVVVAASGRLVAYDVATGTRRWLGPNRGGSYSSPHLMTIGGVPQILMLSGPGVLSVTPAEGKELWSHPWEGTIMLQPALTPDGDLLIAAGDMMGGTGLRRLAVKRGADGWTVEERWTTRGLKPYFNDFVVHDGHAYGFDGSILACIDLANGERKWKGGRYGQGQLVLLADQHLLLVLSEDGELALVNATPDKFTEVARVPAIEGKTWNHPVVSRNILFVRNGEEMAAFKLSLTGAATN